MAADPELRRKDAERASRARLILSPEERRARKRRENEARAKRQGRIYHGADGLGAHYERMRDATVERKAAEKAARMLQAKQDRAALVAALPWRDRSKPPRERFALRYQMDPTFNLKQRLRAGLKRKRQGIKLGDLLRSAISRQGNSPRCEAFVGYTASDLRRHLERQFTVGMSWSAFNDGRIHIDHIRPLSRFDLSDPKEVKAAWALPNLRPMWGPDNIAKGARIELLM